MAYQLLELVAVSGEFPTEQLTRLNGGNSYKLNVVKTLKSKKLLRTYYRDRLRGYRLTFHSKNALCADNPMRFGFYLSGSSETNFVKSEITRRLRLHRIAETTVTMMNANVRIHRGEKPSVFSPIWKEGLSITIRTPAFYNSREIKEMGTVFTKIRGARSVGVLLTADRAFVVYNLGSSLMKWEYKAEMRTKALMKTVLCRERLPMQYQPEAIQGLIFGNDMNLAYEILSEESKQYFVLDGNYEHFFYLTNDRYGERILQLLCDAELTERLESILYDDLYDDTSNIDCDAFDKNGCPVLFAFFCDLPRIKRFDTALRLQNKPGTIICFDFQKDTIARYCNNQILFQTIDFKKWERSFFE